MSANFYATPTKERINVGVNSPSRFSGCLNETFGGGPWKLNNTHVEILAAMDRAVGPRENGYHRLLELIEKYDEIIVEAERLSIDG